MSDNIKIKSNFALKQKEITRFADKLGNKILKGAVAASLQEVANTSAVDFFRATGSEAEARSLPAVPGKVTSRSNRLIASVLGAFNFNETGLPSAVKSVMSQDSTVSGTEVGAGKRESIRIVEVSGGKLTGIIGSETPYAAIHEFGGTINATNLFGKGISARINIPARPYLNPAVRRSRKAIFDIFETSIDSSYKRANI